MSSRSTNITMPALGVALGVVLALVSFLVWRFAGTDGSNVATPPAAGPSSPPAAPAAPRPGKPGQCIEQHLDRDPEVLRPSRYQLPLGAQASNLFPGTHDYPSAVTLVRDGQIIGAIRLFYEHIGAGMQVLEVIDADCAAVQHSAPERVTRDDYSMTFQIAGQAYEVTITTFTVLNLDIVFRLSAG